MPVGSSNRIKRTASPERQHVYVANPAAIIGEDKGQHSFANVRDPEAIERMKMLKDRYGDASAIAQF
jgi:hypothetical protein